MTLLAFLLVLASAFLHASWNFLAKRHRISGLFFMWSLNVIWLVVLFPFVLLFWLQEGLQLPPQSGVFIVGSGLIHIVYFWLLTQGYRVGDLSLVYPLARGTGPLLATIGAILLFSERPTPLAVAGTLLIGFGVFILTGDPRKLRQSKALPGILFALLTGISIASYTLWDSYAVNQMGIPPLLFVYGIGLVIFVLLSPLILLRRGQLRGRIRGEGKVMLVIGSFSALAYVLVLTAFTLLTNPVSYVAPARETSILIGAFMGAYFLSEGDRRRRILAGVVMLLGLFALGVG